METVAAERKQTSIRAYDDFVELVGYVARHYKLSIHDYLDQHVKPLVQEQHDAAVREKYSALGEAGA